MSDLSEPLRGVYRASTADRRVQQRPHPLDRSARPQRAIGRYEVDMYHYGDAEMGYPASASLHQAPRPPTPTPMLRSPTPKNGRDDWASLPLVQAGHPRIAITPCPYRGPYRRPLGSGSGDLGFDQRWNNLTFGMKRFVWEVSAYGLALHHHFSYHEELNDFEAALTVYFAVWTGGQVHCVPPHWQAASWNLQPSDAQTLTLMLSEMTKTEDFRNPRAQGYTLARIDELLSAMRLSSTLLDNVLHIINQSTGSCADSWALMFNDIDLAVRMHAISSSAHDTPALTRGLRELATGLIKLDVVRRHARTYWLAHNFLDQIEVALKFEVLLQRQLNLPVVSRGWQFAGSFHIPAHVLYAADTAARYAVACPGRLGDFLDQWEPWQLHQRQLEVKHFAYAALPERSWQAEAWPDEPLRCIITQEDMDALLEPVFMGHAPNNLRVFEHSALMTWWCQNGRDPLLTRQPLDLTALFRFRF